MKNSWKCVVHLNFFTKTCLTNNYFSHDPHFVILAWVQSWNIFEKIMKLWSPQGRARKFSPKIRCTNNYFWFDPSLVTQHGYKVEIFLKNSWECNVRHNFFTKIRLTNINPSCDRPIMILAWVQSWNKFEKLMKLCCLPELFHKNMSHERLSPFHNA